MTDRELMQQALEVLKSTGLFLHHCWCNVRMNEYSFDKLVKQMDIVDAQITALRKRLAQPEQPSVPWSAALEAVWGEPEQEPVIGKWSLREVYFDEDGEPISHRSPPQRKPEQEPVVWALPKMHPVMELRLRRRFRVR